MPRKYIRKKKKPYLHENCKIAKEEVENSEGKVSIAEAAAKYNIPYTTLYYQLKKNSRESPGRPQAIPKTTEDRLGNATKILEKWGFGLSRAEILNLVGDYVRLNDMKTPFKDGIPGEDWFLNFKHRQQLSIKKPQSVEYVRKAMTDPFIVDEYFKLLENTLSELKLSDKPHLIWNLDETSLSLDPSRTKVVGAVNKPSSRTTYGTGKENITVLAGVSASGKKLPPLIVYKGKNLWDQWLADNNEKLDFELAYAATSKGWMEAEVFHNYIKTILIPNLGAERPVLIIYDGHSTHVDIKVVELAIQNQITILKLPPHTSHLLQPLDLCVFKPFKALWDAKLVDWQRRNIGVKMPKQVFAKTLAATWNETSTDVIKSGFKKAGIYPLNVNVVAVEKYDPVAYKRFLKSKSDQILPLENPLTLKQLSLNYLNEVFIALHKFEQKKDVTIPKISSFLGKDPFRLSASNPQAHCSSKLQIISQIVTKQGTAPDSSTSTAFPSEPTVSFEELLLNKIAQDKKNNAIVKKRRLCKGAEVITTSLSGNLLGQDFGAVASASYKVKKGKGSEVITASSNANLLGQDDCAVASTSKIVKKGSAKDVKKKKPQDTKITVAKGRKQVKKRKRALLNSSETSVSDVLSEYSDDLDFTNLDWDFDTTFEDLDCMSKPLTPQSHETKKTVKGKGVGKKSKAVGKENQSINDTAYGINDAVLVRYFEKNKWKYYIGFIENILKKYDDIYFSVDFLKTITKPILYFTKPKKKDHDEVPILSIVKKVELKKREKKENDHILCNSCDSIYF